LFALELDLDARSFALGNATAKGLDQSLYLSEKNREVERSSSRHAPFPPSSLARERLRRLRSRWENTSMREQAKAGILADSQERLLAVVRPDIEREIRARHADEPVQAGLFERIQIEARIRAEIREALAKAAPAEAVY
jgi:hypothetical protein